VYDSNHGIHVPLSLPFITINGTTLTTWDIDLTIVPLLKISPDVLLAALLGKEYGRTDLPTKEQIYGWPTTISAYLLR
jgi:hypothetical protein